MGIYWGLNKVFLRFDYLWKDYFGWSIGNEGIVIWRINWKGGILKIRFTIKFWNGYDGWIYLKWYSGARGFVIYFVNKVIKIC